MKITRRKCLELIALTAVAPIAIVRRVAGQENDAVAARIARVIREYEAQGFHRTGTAVDQASGDWLAGEVKQTGLTPALESFSLSRVDVVTSVLVIGDRRIEGLPLFDGAFTNAGGVRGRLGALDTDAEIGLIGTRVNAAGAGPLGEARRATRHKAVVAITQGSRPGLCPSNADLFLRPFGPPVLQVSSEHATWLDEQAKQGTTAQLIAQVSRASTTANNVTAALPGTDLKLAPMIVMTPRSGWYWCASERGGGIASWLEIMRGLRTIKLKRTVLFVASSGHELGHLGIDAFIERRPGVVKNATGWLHLGANIGAATEPGTVLQASDDEFDSALTKAMTNAGLGVTARNPRGKVPGGEAEAVHRGGGRYVSVIGGNGLFHNLEDRGPQAVDPITIAKFSTAFTEMVRSMADA